MGGGEGEGVTRTAAVGAIMRLFGKRERRGGEAEEAQREAMRQGAEDRDVHSPAYILARPRLFDYIFRVLFRYVVKYIDFDGENSAFSNSALNFGIQKEDYLGFYCNKKM